MIAPKRSLAPYAPTVADFVAFGVVAAAIGVLTLFNGANRPVPWTALCVAVFVAGAIALIGEALSLRRRSSAADWITTAPLALVVGVLIAAGSGLLTPEALDASAARQTEMRLAAYAIAFWIATRALADATIARRFVDGAALYGGGVALLGLGFYVTGTNFLLEEAAGGVGYARGPFVNPNAFAFFCTMGALSALASIDRRITSSEGHDRAADMLRAFTGGAAWIYGVALIAAMVAIAASASRAGLLLAILGGVGYALLRPAPGRSLISRNSGARIGFLGAIVVAIIVAFAIGGQRTLDEIDRAAADEGRSLINAVGAEAIEAAPWFGYGLGAYPHAVRPYLPEQIADMEWDKAHNLYLELAVELGLPLAAAWFAALGWVALGAFGGVANRRRRRDLVALPATLILVATLHSAVDFPLQMPAVAVLFVCLVAVARAPDRPSAPRATLRSQRGLGDINA